MIHYSSMFIENNYLEVEKILSKYENRNTTFFLDTNICIDLFKLWHDPRNFRINNNAQFVELSKLAKAIYNKNIQYIPFIGINESTRQLKNGKTSYTKQTAMVNAIKYLLSTSFSNFQNHCDTNEFYETEVITKFYDETKIRYIFNDNFMGKMLLLKYCSMLKFYQIQKQNLDFKSKYNEFFNFLFEDINCLDGGSMAACVCSRGNSTKKGFIHSKTDNYVSVLDAIMNASIDLCQVEMIAGAFKEGMFPVFVTGDRLLCEIHETMKIYGFEGKLPLKGLYLEKYFSNKDDHDHFMSLFEKYTHGRDSKVKLFKEEYLWAKVRNLEKEIKLTTAST